MADAPCFELRSPQVWQADQVVFIRGYLFRAIVAASIVAAVLLVLRSPHALVAVLASFLAVGDRSGKHHLIKHLEDPVTVREAIEAAREARLQAGTRE